MNVILKLTPFALPTGSLVLLAGALYFQHFLNLYPCELCIWQRYAHGAIIVTSIIFLVKKEIYTGSLVSVAILSSIAVSLYHVGVEQNIFKGLQGCSFDLSNLTKEKLREITISSYTAKCDEVVWDFLNISMAGWNAIISFFMFLTWIGYLIFIRKNKIEKTN